MNRNSSNQPTRLTAQDRAKVARPIVGCPKGNALCVMVRVLCAIAAVLAVLELVKVLA